MNFNDFSLFMWISIFAIGSVLVFAPLIARGRLATKFEKVLALFSNPNSIVRSLKTVSYDIPDAAIALQIIESWFPHEETEALDGAPTPVCGRISKSMNLAAGQRSLAFELFYELLLPNSNIALARRRGTLICYFRNHPSLRQTEIEYVWDGAEFAFTDIFSTDYKILHYMVDRIRSEFLCRGYKEIAAANEPLVTETRARAIPGAQVKQWWRTYSAGEHGEKVYSFWPSPQDYSEAVQNPSSNFKDAGLKKCLPVLNALGIPRVTSGMFASVYQFKNETEQWALRCFDTRLIDQQERYKAISNFILSDDLTYTVDFHYLEDGIKSGDTWFPVLKMTWVEGQPLDLYVGAHLQDSAALQKLRNEFQTMMEKLRSNGVAHCDLQHGNILVSDAGEIFLVDYDAFYVPELAGRHSNELGHANYQHPTRTEKYFGPYLDNFAALVIDLSLLCLSEDPSLWEKFRGGDECLLFRKSDYVNPETSRLISTLKHHRSQRIVAGVQKLLAYLQMPLTELPYLSAEAPDLIPLAQPQVQLEEL
jgi:hypothetical protein